ncbi:MAG TPA: hypothetical protein VJ011_08775 [Steroidobacteraceae bacterium]|nr:hypothetical protein [Steroidobacteraceae bacterium]
MNDHLQGEGRPDAAFIARAEPLAVRARSKMLDAYCAEVESLLHDAATGQALRLALDLPHICVALGESDLRSSCERFTAWCRTWLDASSGFEPPDRPESSDEVFARWCATSSCGELEAPQGVPVQALKRLRLRRLARALPLCRKLFLALPASAEDSYTRESALRLVEGARRWYLEHGGLDPTVQSNLARLAVLR